jgi:hypothetical protein
MNRHRFCHWIELLPCLLLCASIARAAVRADPVVLAGTDYFQTTAGTTFGGVPFMGVPLGSFNFPPVVSTGNTDTIIQRTSDVSLPSIGSSGVTPLVIRALQLESAVPADFGLGADFYFITLQSARPGGGTASTGSMTITLGSMDDHLPGTPEGSFSSSLDVFFDVRKGSLSGAIAMSSDLVLTNSGALWDADPTPADFIVSGAVGDQDANLHTNKNPTQMDFFPTFISESSGGDTHNVQPTQNPVPEPSMRLLLAALLGCAGIARKHIAGWRLSNQLG